MRIEDISAAVDFLQERPETHSENGGGLDVCASPGKLGHSARGGNELLD